MSKDIVYSFQESIEAVDKGRNKCLSHDDYWINIILPGRVPLLMSEWISMEDIDNLKGYDDLLWQRVHEELEPLMDPYGFCTPPARLFYLTLLFALFFWFVLGILVGRSYLWPFGFIDYGMKLILVIPWWVSLIFLAFLTGVFIFLLWSITSKVKKCDERLAQKSDELKELVQDLIESALELFKKENIDPQEYPLRLKFNDYPGLEYVKEEKDLEKYIAYLKV